MSRDHEADLLVPAQVDELTGYRYYAADQIPTVHRILGAADRSTRAELVTEHLHHLESELDQTRADVRSLRRLLAPEPAPVDVEVRPVNAGTCWCIVPLRTRRTGTGARGRPAGRGLAVATHAGDHADIDVTYGEVGAWAVANAPQRRRAGPGDVPRGTS